MRDAEQLDPATGKSPRVSSAASRRRRSCRFRVIVTDGAFSMDGDIAPLDEICDLAEKYDALVHGGRLPLPPASSADRPRHPRALRRDGARGHHHHHLRQGAGRRVRRLHRPAGRRSSTCCATRRRPYLFSNTVPPRRGGRHHQGPRPAVRDTALRDTLEPNTRYFRERDDRRRFRHHSRRASHRAHHVVPTPTVEMAVEFAARLLEEGIYVIAFFYPVVPRGKDRIRVQISAAHERSTWTRPSPPLPRSAGIGHDQVTLPSETSQGDLSGSPFFIADFGLRSCGFRIGDGTPFVWLVWFVVPDSDCGLTSLSDVPCSAFGVRADHTCRSSRVKFGGSICRVEWTISKRSRSKCWDSRGHSCQWFVSLQLFSSRRWALRMGMPEAMVQMCRSWTSRTWGSSSKAALTAW